MNWYILKVQSNREESIREGLQRRVAVAGLERYFGDIIVPTEMVSEFKGGKKRVVKRKLYPGYLVVNMEINEDTWFLVRETPGIGDFTGSAGKPTPMLPHEVSKIVAKQEEKTDEAPKLKINFNVGDRVKINEGTFENFEGEVDSIDEASGRVTVMINIFGRSTPVELEYWQIEAIENGLKALGPAGSNKPQQVPNHGKTTRWTSEVPGSRRPGHAGARRSAPRWAATASTWGSSSRSSTSGPAKPAACRSRSWSTSTTTAASTSSPRARRPPRC